MVCVSGSAIVTETKAALWTDGRYFLQANMELDCNWILQREGQLLSFSSFRIAGTRTFLSNRDKAQPMFISK